MGEYCVADLTFVAMQQLASEVPFADDIDVVCGVARDDISKGPHREGIITGYAAPHPGFGRHIGKQGDRSETHGPEFLGVSGPRELVGGSPACRDFLIVAGQRRLETSGKPERSERKSPLRVSNMIEHLPDAPFIRGVAVPRFLFGDLREQYPQVFELAAQNRVHVYAGDLVYVREVVGRSL